MPASKTTKSKRKTVAKPAAKKGTASKTGKNASKAETAKTSAPAGKRKYWLFKSEPDKFSWDMLKARGKKGEEWDGVRNYQARNNMRAMQIGDLGFFYHSNAGKDIVGIAAVSALAHPDSTTDDERWECVDVVAVCDMPKSVSLADVKANPKLSEMSLVTSMRLSVQPVTQTEWKEVCRMGGLDMKSVEAGLKRSLRQ